MKKAPTTISLLVLVPLVAAGMGACASAPKSSSSEPALVIPLPPPHVVPINTEPVLEPVGEIPGANAPVSAPANRTGRGNREAAPRPQGTDNRPEAKPDASAAPTSEPPPTAAPAPPSGPLPQLRTTESSGTEATVRATLDRARQMLSGVDYRRLTDIRKKAYDDAKKFADQADEALKQGNVVFAQGVAGKAETLAKELAGR